MNFLPKLWNSIKNFLLATCFIAVIVAGGWAAYIYDSSKKPQTAEKQLIVEGDNALNVGRYNDAKRIFDAELKANPQNKQAAWGLQLAQLHDALGQADFKESIDAPYRKAPNDAHLNLFLGEYYAAHKQPELARKHFQQAITANPKLAEAHYKMAMLHEKLGNLGQAKVEILIALDIAPLAKYRNKLGATQFKQQHYEEAIKEFGRNKEYPLSALESSKIYWRLEYLSQALSYQKQAVEWLEEPSIMAKPENQEAWHFEIPPEQQIVLAKLNEKKSYAYYCVSISLFLQGDSEGADAEVKKQLDLKVTSPAAIRALLNADLDALVTANGNLKSQADAYKKLYL